MFCSIGWSSPAHDHGHDQETRGRSSDEQPDADNERRQGHQVSVFKTLCLDFFKTYTSSAKDVGFLIKREEFMFTLSCNNHISYILKSGFYFF